MTDEPGVARYDWPCRKGSGRIIFYIWRIRSIFRGIREKGCPGGIFSGAFIYQLALMKVLPHEPLLFDQQAPGGDEDAFRQLYEQYAYRLFRFVYGYIHSRELAEEAVNDAFMALWKRRDRLGEISHIYLYLCKAVKNIAIDYLRAGKMGNTGTLDDILQADHLGFVMDPEHIMLNSELGQRIRHSIQDLPPRCRMIFKLIKEDGLKYKEVASLLDISPRTVETQLAIALKRIGQSLLPYLQEDISVRESR